MPVLILVMLAVWGQILTHEGGQGARLPFSLVILEGAINYPETKESFEIPIVKRAITNIPYNVGWGSLWITNDKIVQDAFIARYTYSSEIMTFYSASGKYGFRGYFIKYLKLCCIGLSLVRYRHDKKVSVFTHKRSGAEFHMLNFDDRPFSIEIGVSGVQSFLLRPRHLQTSNIISIAGFLERHPNEINTHSAQSDAENGHPAYWGSPKGHGFLGIEVILFPLILAGGIFYWLRAINAALSGQTRTFGSDIVLGCFGIVIGVAGCALISAPPF